MKIAILAWGSLYWDPRELKTTGEWFFDGPALPIEYARISGGNRLTLVIKPGFDSVTTLYAISSYRELDAARENLRERENTPNLGNIGFIDFLNNTSHVREANKLVIDTIKEWNTHKGFDALLWSDFAPRFTDQLTIENILSFIQSLPNYEKEAALEYIRKTPPQVSTRFRESIEYYFKEAPL